MKQTRWIHSPIYDLWWFIAPVALLPLGVLLFPNLLPDSQQLSISPLSWLLIVLAIDVAHVYSTVFKTYFNPVARSVHHRKLILIPLIAWIGGVLLYAGGSKLFWTVIAYFAVFHFIRQQYGFFRLYSRSQTPGKWIRTILNTSIYAVMLLPIAMWHCLGQRHFNWMTEGDFFYLNRPEAIPFLQVLLLTILIVYLLAEFSEKRAHGFWNIPRLLLTTGTALSYYVSMVVTDSDFVFSLLNVVGHGVPYMALVWHSESLKSTHRTQQGIMEIMRKKWGWIVFYNLTLVFAYLEESIWDVFVWREQTMSFGWLYPFTSMIQQEDVLLFLVPFLVVPQMTHYLLDGFIWRKKDTSDLFQNV